LTPPPAIDLFLALLLAAGALVAIWYYVGDGEGLKGELAVRLGGESLGLATLGDREDLWDFGEWRKFVAAENPATDDRLVEWLAAQPGVSNVRVRRDSDPQELDRSHFDTTLTLRYDRPGDLGQVPIDWPAFGYRAIEDNARTRKTGLLGKPKVQPGHSRGVLWLIAVACAHGALLVVVLVRGAGALFRRRPPLPPADPAPTTPVLVSLSDRGLFAQGRVVDRCGSASETGSCTPGLVPARGEPPPVAPAAPAPTPPAFAPVLVAAVVLLVLVVFHELLVAAIVPHATARGWVWFSSVAWRNKNVACGSIYLAFLTAPLAAQLFFRSLLVGRWKEAGRPAVGVSLAAVAFAALWLDASLVPLGLVVGGVLGWLACRGVPVVGLFLLHALVNGVLFVFLLSGSPPPDGHDPRLEDSWVQVDGVAPPSWGRIAFTANGRVVLPEWVTDGVPSEASVEWYYLALGRDRVIFGVGGRVWKCRVAFEGDELIFTPDRKSRVGPPDRFRRLPKSLYVY
jgi:hypothetical protein